MLFCCRQRRATGSRAQIVCERKFFLLLLLLLVINNISPPQVDLFVCARRLALSCRDIHELKLLYHYHLRAKEKEKKMKRKKNWARNVDIRANIGLNERFMVRIFTASSRWRRRRRWASGVVAFDHIFREIVNTQPRARERTTWKRDIVSRVWSSCQCWPEIIAVTPQLWLKTFKSPHTQFTILSTRARPCEGREEQKNSSEKKQHDSVKKKNRKIIKYNFYHSLFQHCRHDMAPPRCREKALKVRVTPPPIVAYQHRVSLLLITYAKPRMTNVNGGGVLGTCEWEKNRNEIETFPLAYTIWWITQVLILFVFHLRNSLSPIFRQHVHCCDDTNKI